MSLGVFLLSLVLSIYLSLPPALSLSILFFKIETPENELLHVIECGSPTVFCKFLLLFCKMKTKTTTTTSATKNGTHNAYYKRLHRSACGNHMNDFYVFANAR